MFGQPLLLRLVEVLDLAAGLRVGPRVGGGDHEQTELNLQGGPAFTAQPAGEDRCVVSQHVGGKAVSGERVGEADHHVGSQRGGPGVGGDAEPGMVVEALLR